jgi:hypothetical protein
MGVEALDPITVEKGGAGPDRLKLRFRRGHTEWMERDVLREWAMDGFGLD